MLANVMQKEPDASSQEPALIRHNAVSWIQQSLSQGHTLGRALALASQLAWGGRYYSPRTLEGWFYEYRAAGFAGLHRQSRRDKGQIRALSSEDVQAIVKLRLSQPALPVSSPCPPSISSRGSAAGHFQHAQHLPGLTARGP
jgi:hypothetical protein